MNFTVRFSPGITMKVKSKTVYWIAAAVIVVAFYLFINPPAPDFVATRTDDVSRFSPNSLDVQLAMGGFTRDPPKTLASPPPMKPLLLFPPSEDDLKKLSGPPTSV
jgi:hypothetical protein